VGWLIDYIKTYVDNKTNNITLKKMLLACFVIEDLNKKRFLKMKALNDVMIATLEKNSEYEVVYNSILKNINKYFNMEDKKKKITEQDISLGIEFLKE